MRKQDSCETAEKPDLDDLDYGHSNNRGVEKRLSETSAEPNPEMRNEGKPNANLSSNRKVVLNKSASKLYSSTIL